MDEEDEPPGNGYGYADGYRDKDEEEDANLATPTPRRTTFARDPHLVNGTKGTIPATKGKRGSDVSKRNSVSRLPAPSSSVLSTSSARMSLGVVRADAAEEVENMRPCSSKSNQSFSARQALGNQDEDVDETF